MLDGELSKRFVLFLLGEKGFRVLDTFIEHNKGLIKFVVIGKDSNLEDDFSLSIENRLRECGIKYYTRKTAPNLHSNDVAYAVGWRWLIDHPNSKLIILHDSLLPKFRGFSPMVNMLIKGERNIGVTAIWGSQQYDKGDIIIQSSSKISYPIKVKEAIKKNLDNYEVVTKKILSFVNHGLPLPAIQQNESDASYSIWRDENDYLIDWGQSSTNIKRFIDAVGPPYAGAHTFTNLGQKIIIDNVQIAREVSLELRHIGKVLFVENGNPVIICGEGLLKITAARIFRNHSTCNFLPLANFRTKFNSLGA